MLGCAVYFDVDGNCHMDCSKFIGQLGQRYGHTGKFDRLPCPMFMAKFDVSQCPEVGSTEYLKLRERAIRYRSLVAAMLYAVTTVRPEAAYSVGVLCRFMDNPAHEHIMAADQLLGYLVGTKNLGLMFHVGNEELHSTYRPLEPPDAASDSDWSTGRSISGFYVCLAGAAVAWCSKRQPVTALSSTEAEYYAASAAGTEVLFIRYLLRDVGYPQKEPTNMRCDNSACVALSVHSNAFKRVRHIDRRVNFLTDYVEAKQLKLNLVSTHNNESDLFTKPLDRAKFIKFRDTIMGLYR